MKSLYNVAGNIFEVDAEDGNRAWEELKFRFAPFATKYTVTVIPVFSVAIKIGKLTKCDAETIYEPNTDSGFFIKARAARCADGTVIIDFGHITEQKLRMRLHLSPIFDKATVELSTDIHPGDSYFLAHALMIAYLLGTARNGTLLIHSSAVLLDGKAYAFQGKSGTGKSTHADLWLKHIAGTERLNDDNPVVRLDGNGTAMLYGSPWSGKTHCYRNTAAPVGAFVRIVRAKENELRRLSPLAAYASLTTSLLYLPFVDSEMRDARHRTIERLVSTVPCYEMYCRPDADAARTCAQGLTDKQQDPQ